MQIKIITVPVSDTGVFTLELNNFLKNNKILEVEKQLVSNDNGAYWCFCISYIDTAYKEFIKSNKKVDYREVLDDATFKKFSTMRALRKKIAADDGIPAFAVFTDEELAELAKLDTLTKGNMLSIKGIGDKKIEKFADLFIEEMKPK